MATGIKARRLLSELFKKGVEVRFKAGPNGPEGKIGPFEDENGTRIPPGPAEVAMFIRPADPIQRDMAMRASQGKRAAALVRAKREKGSEEHLTIMAFLADMSDETLIDYVCIAEAGERLAEAEREVIALDEWKDMTAYQDQMRAFQEMDPADLEGNQEWLDLLDLDDKYRSQIQEREIQLNLAQREALRFVSRENIETKALEKRSEMVGTQAFMAEYEKQMLFYSVRDAENIDTLFFEKADELAAQPDEVRDLINEALLPFLSEAGEAKNLLGADPGSDLSDPPSNAETSESSTREEQIG